LHGANHFHRILGLLNKAARDINGIAQENIILTGMYYSILLLSHICFLEL
jgi:hypothetical protein